MLPANIYHPEEESTTNNMYVPRLSTMAANIVPHQHISVDASVPPTEPSLSFINPLASSPNMKVNLIVEVQSRKRTLSYDYDADNKRYCRRDSESGFSSENTSEMHVSSPEADICYLFQSPPLIKSPYNYRRDYSFCNRNRKENKPLDLTKESCDAGNIINRKICLNSVDKDVYLEPMFPEMSCKDEEQLCVPLNLSDTNDDDKEIILNACYSNDGDHHVALKIKELETQNNHDVVTTIVTTRQIKINQLHEVSDNNDAQYEKNDNLTISENIHDTVEVSDLASQCLQEFFQSWNEAGSQELHDVLLYTDYENNTPGILLEPTLETSFTPQDKNTSTQLKVAKAENIEAGIIYSAVESDSSPAFKQNTEETPNKNSKLCPLLSMPLLGGEPELPPISIEEENEEKQSDPLNREVSEEDKLEPQNVEINSQNSETLTEDTQTPSQNSIESNEKPELNMSDNSPETGMLDILMKPTLPQNCTLSYSRLFNSEVDEFLSRPSVSPMPCMPVLLTESQYRTKAAGVKMRKSRTPNPVNRTRVQPKRRASIGSVSSYSPSPSSTPSSPVMPTLEPNIHFTPLRRSSSRLSIPTLDYEGSSLLIGDMTSEESAPSTPRTRSCSKTPNSVLSVDTHLPTTSGSAEPRTTPCQRRGRPKKIDLLQRAVSPAIARVQSVSSPMLRSRSQSPARGGGKGSSPAARGRSHSPAAHSKIKRVSLIKATLESKAKILSSEQLAVMKEREKMLNYDRWMEERQLLYSRLLPEVSTPEAVRTNMQPKVVLERNIGLDARAISEAVLLKQQAVL